MPKITSLNPLSSTNSLDRFFDVIYEHWTIENPDLIPTGSKPNAYET